MSLTAPLAAGLLFLLLLGAWRLPRLRSGLLVAAAGLLGLLGLRALGGAFADRARAKRVVRERRDVVNLAEKQLHRAVREDADRAAAAAEEQSEVADPAGRRVRS